MTVEVGDRVAFIWSGTHNVYQSASLSDYTACVKQGGHQRAWISVNAYVHRFIHAGTYYFLCAWSRHCEAGQKIAITATATGSAVQPSPPPNPPGVALSPPPPSPPPTGTNHYLQWTIPMNPRTLSISLGDSVTFTWTAYHNGVPIGECRRLQWLRLDGRHYACRHEPQYVHADV